MSGLVTEGVLTLCCADMDARPLFWTTYSGGRDGLEPASPWEKESLNGKKAEDCSVRLR